MQTFRSADVRTEPADPAHFSGTARVTRVEAAGAPPVLVYRVEFEPGARTNWHTHSGVQVLLVTEGRGRVQKWGESIREIGPGDTVSIAPGDKHWHGATRDSRLVHVAVNIDAKTTWMEPVNGD
jgi:quercetin dioxygenase-like cupin family protein